LFALFLFDLFLFALFLFDLFLFDLFLIFFELFFYRIVEQMSNYFWDYFYGKDDTNEELSPIQYSQTRLARDSPLQKSHAVGFPRNRSLQNLTTTYAHQSGSKSDGALSDVNKGGGESGDHVLYINFSSDDRCFSCGTDHGFLIYNCDPFVERFRRKMSGGIGIAELLGKSNIVFLVGGGIRPEFSPNKVIVWDDYQSKVAHELEYTTEVLCVKSRSNASSDLVNRVVVVLYHQTLVYLFENFELEHQYDTFSNPLGICELNRSGNVLVTLGNKLGDIRIEFLEQRKSHIINAHKTSIGCLSLNPDGSLLASCSQKGTLIRIWETKTGKLLKELRRGIEQTNVISLSFNSESSFLCLSSEKGTIHVYSLLPRQEVRPHEKNKKSSLSFMRHVVPIPQYFASEWSCFSFSLAKNNQIGKCAFSPSDPNALIILTDDGSYLKYRIDGTTAHLITTQTF